MNKSSKFDPKTMKNESKTAPKQNQAKPRGPHGNLVEQKVGFVAVLGVTWGRLGRPFAPLWVALVDLLLLLGSLWTPFLDFDGFWVGLEAQQMYF